MRENTELRILNISDILPNRFQPRLKFEQSSLEELALSISKFGVIEPIVVRPVGNKFEIIAGERRYKASKLASKSTIPAIIINLSDKDSEELALLENVQRQALNPIEEAVSYKRILDAGYITREALAKKIGKTQTVIFNKIRLLNLSDEVQSYLLNNKISERHARSLLKISDLDDQVEMLHRIVNERLTVKQTDKEISKMLDINKINLDNSSEEGIENLFGDERGKDSMDIDKIMREAKDINSDIKTDPQNIPNLMAKSNDVQSEPIVREEKPIDPVIAPADSKFVNGAQENFMSQTTSSTTVSGVDKTSDVTTFDDMFNKPLPNDLPFNVNQNMNDIPSNEFALNNNDQKEISNVVANAFSDYNQNKAVDNTNSQNSKFINSIPDTDIYRDDLVQTNLNISSAENSKDLESTVPSFEPTPVPLANDASIDKTNSMSDFSKVVQMLRDCADKIEKEGHFVNVEEIDLGSQYKVIFNINK